MSIEINSSDYFNNLLGSYSPLSLRIKIKKTLTENSKKDSGISSLHKEDHATLFHEFMHQLQNTSSIIGFNQFNAIVSTWHNTRNITDDPEDEESRKHRNKAITELNKYQSNNKNILDKRKDLLQISEIDKLQEILARKEELPEPIKIKYFFNDEQCSLLFGTYELYESCAYALEKLFRKKIDAPLLNDNEALAVPYKICESLAKKLFPNCSDYQLIIIMLTVLQVTIPAQTFIYLLDSFSKYPNMEIQNECRDHVKSAFEANTKWISEADSIIDEGFPIDDPHFGNVIKSFKNSIVKNLKRRIQTPFLELDFIMSINKDNYVEEMNQWIQSFGGALIYIEDDLNQSFNPIVIGNKESIYFNHKGWLTFCVSMFLALMEKMNPDHDRGYECPVIIYCDHENKTNISKCGFCKIAPYKHPEASSESDNCAHQLALYKSDLKNLKK